MRIWFKRMAAALLGCAAFAPRAAPAKCPESNLGDVLCEPVVSYLMPAVAGVAYFPHAAGGPYLGGGVEVALFSWSHNNDASGPSQGRLRATFAYLAGTDSRRVALYHLGGLVSFEGNASRHYLIPYFSAAIGGLSETVLGSHPGADASIGLFIVHTRHFILDAEGGAVLPFTSADALVGPRVQLTASFSLW